MPTVKEFHEQFEDVERGLIDMLCMPYGNVPIIAEQCLKELYEIKQELFTVFLSPNPDTPIELLFPNYPRIKKFVDENYEESSEKKIILENQGRNLRFNDAREKDLKFFIGGGYIQR